MVDPLAAAKHVEEILTGEMRSRSLILARRLGIFDVLYHQPSTLEQLSQTLSIKNVSAFDKLLRTLLGMRLLELESSLYSVSEIGQASLVVDAPANMGPLVDFFADQYGIKSIGHIQAHLQLATELRPPPTPEQWRTYMKAMEAMARMSALPIAQTLALDDAATLLDLGGGPGSYAIAFCQTYSKLNATIYDLDAALAVAVENVKSAGLADRIQLTSGSATDVSFGANYDVIFVSHTIHLFDAATTARMFHSCFRALNPGGKLVVRDVITDERGVQPVLGAFIGLNMWVEGDAYSFQCLRRMMVEIGYESVEHLPISRGDMPDVLGSLVVAQKGPTPK
ncbi:MAG: ubiquinone/menaquinone biosynthesis C-methylase UbiE [Pirellulaceae bacterium]|jgi:ubiquinone/menaquinone biosynthesis C-methylase UbiE